MTWKRKTLKKKQNIMANTIKCFSKNGTSLIKSDHNQLKLNKKGQKYLPFRRS